MAFSADPHLSHRVFLELAIVLTRAERINAVAVRLLFVSQKLSFAIM